MSDSLKSRIQEEMKAAMRAKAKERLSVIRMLQAAIKQQEIDSREELDEAGTLATVEKLIKRGRQSAEQYRENDREDLAAKEDSEIVILEEFMPAQLSEAEILQVVDAAIAESGAASPQDMGKVMKLVKPQLQGQADMGQVSGLVRSRLQG